jgi:hypothetical protein
MRHLSRRNLLLGLASLPLAAPRLASARTLPAIHVLKDPNCGCCDAWVQILRDDGFEVTTETSLGTALIRHKTEAGIPQAMMSCHTAEIDGYMIEGHVPPADIRRLLAERPGAVGLAVPGMPYGSPGMGPEDRREAYDVFLILPDGRTQVFTRYAAA